MASGRSYGKSLPDQVDRIASLSQAHLDLLGDACELYKEYSALEREYASKLQQLAKKATDKKNKKLSSIILGPEPIKHFDEIAVTRSTLERAYFQLINALNDTAQDHAEFADAINAGVIEALKSTEQRYEETNRRQLQFYQKILSDRDKIYTGRLKAKQKYDEECTELESYRQKQERSSDDRHAERAARQYEQQKADMLNSKNVYLLSIALANSAKSKYFSEDLPALEDQYQNLQTQVLTKFSHIVCRVQDIRSGHLEMLKTRVVAVDDAFKSLNPSEDQDLFIEYNENPFSEPPDWTFEPCGSYYDTGEMSVDPAPKVYLQNRLAKCKEKVQEVKLIIASKKKEAEQFAQLVEAYSESPTLGDVESVSDNYLEAEHQLTLFTTLERMLQTEIESISATLGGEEGLQCPHTFKSSSFSIPTQCAYCKSSIWGLSKQGKTCKGCGISVHSKCELKIPADCPGSERHGSTPLISASYTSISRSDSLASTAPVVIAPSASSFAQSDSSSTQPEDAYPAARVVFDFSPTSPFELHVTEGALVHIIEDDDGSGWVKVIDDAGGKGLVPASYVQVVETISEDFGVTAAHDSQDQQASRKRVRVLYDYKAQSAGELDIREGQLLELSSGPTGGQYYAEGWWEGFGDSGNKGIFPSNYVEIVP